MGSRHPSADDWAPCRRRNGHRSHWSVSTGWQALRPGGTLLPPSSKRQDPVYPLDLPRAVQPSDLAGWVVEQLNRSQSSGRLTSSAIHWGHLSPSGWLQAWPELVRRLVLIAPPGIRPRGSTIRFAWPLIASLESRRPKLPNETRSGRITGRAGEHPSRRTLRRCRRRKVGGGKVVAPTLLIWGAGDRIVPSITANQWLEALADAQLHVIPTASHVPMVEAPDELVAVISKFRDER